MTGKKRSTIKDVAQKAEVSCMAVSLAFRGSPKISAGTRKKILDAAKQLCYTPDQAARQLRSGKSDWIGFMVPDVSNPFHTRMMKQAQKLFQTAGMNLFFAGSDWDGFREEKSVETLIRLRARGALICSTEHSGNTFRMLKNAGIPFVALDTVPDGFDSCCVINDLEQCGRLVGAHFREIGVTHPVYLNAGESLQKFSAFRHNHHGFASEIPCRVIPAGLTMEAGAQAFHKLKRYKKFPDGIFCVNDLCAAGFMEEAQNHGLHAGRDYALAGIDDIPLSGMKQISLTTVRQPFDQLAQEAFAMLRALMDGHMPERTMIRFSPELIRRDTTLAFRPEHTISFSKKPQ